MKKLFFTILLVSLNSFANDDNISQNYTLGLGMGPMYTGSGVNYSIVSATELKYISFGCINSTDSRNNTSCGLGAGWVSTELFDSTTNKHGFGTYLSLVDNETDDSSLNSSVEDVYGLGVSYIYFLNGIDASGFNLGISFHLTNAEITGKFGGRLQIGYQF